MSFYGDDPFNTPPEQTPGSGTGDGDGSTYRAFDYTGPTMPNEPIPSLDGTPDGGGYYTTENGTPTGNRALTVEEKLFQEQHPNGGSFSNPLAAQQDAYNAQVADGQNPTGRPPTIEEQNFQGTYPNGGSFPNISPIETHAAPAPGPTFPNEPTGGTSTGSGTGGHGQLTPDQWKQDFENKFGFYDDRFNSRDNMLANAQRGDTQIKGQLDYMSGLDSDANRVNSAINALPDFYRSQDAFKWGGEHNQEIANRVQALRGNEFALPGGEAGGAGFNGPLHGGKAPAGGGGQNIEAMNNLVNQEWHAPAGGPVDNYHALVTDQMRGAIAETLAGMGATNIKQGFDGYGNMTLDFTTKSGQQRTIPESLVNYAQTLEQLKGMTPPAANPPAGNGGNGYNAPRGNGAPRGGGNAPRGGGGPATQPGPYAGPVAAYDTSVTPTSGIAGAGFGTNAGGETIAGPASNHMGPIVDEFGNPYGAGYNPDVTGQTAGRTIRPY